MDWVGIYQNAILFVKKYRFVLLLLISGLFLMMIPDTSATDTTVPETKGEKQEKTLADSLEEILSDIYGAGKVKVLLSCSVGPETVYQFDEDQSGTASASDIRRNTVIVTDSQRAQSGLVRMQIGPEYLGAIVLCQGADSATVRLAIVEAVSNVTGLPTSSISVLKMK